VAAMTDAVARAISLLPTLGENPSGPLAPGRLSRGHVGTTIRVIQTQLHDTTTSRTHDQACHTRS
jgi:hypothetical protein